MNADARCGIDLDAAVDTYESVGSTDADSTGIVGDESADGSGSDSIPTIVGEADAASGDESTSTAVVSAVADAKGVDPLDLEPLYEVVDGDALDAMFAGHDGSSSLELRFSMAGCEVVVRGEADVSVTPPTRQRSAGAAASHGD